MTNLELVLNMLAEATTTEISQKEKPQGFDESLAIAKEGGSVAGDARRTIEKRVGKSRVKMQSRLKCLTKLNNLYLLKRKKKRKTNRILYGND